MSAQKNSSLSPRNLLAFLTLGISVLAIIVLGIVAIYRANDPDKQALTIFNMVLPVIASWVGTVLAFYFGRENFESANKQVKEIVQQLTPEQKGDFLVSSIMRKPLKDMTCFSIPEGKSVENITVKDIKKELTKNITRLPILRADNSPLFLIHESRVDSYIADGGNVTDSLQTYLDTQKDKGYTYGVNRGFVVVSKNTRLMTAKEKMEDIQSCQDIFVTENGNPDEPIIGWISNIRLAKFLGN